MKRMNLFLGLTLTLMLVACGQKNKESSVSAIRSSGARGNTQIDQLAASGNWLALQSNQLDAATRAFVSSFMDPANLGSVTGMYSNNYNNNYYNNYYQNGFNNTYNQANIGVFIKPQLRIVNGSIDPRGSILTLKINDSLVGQLDGNGNAMPEIPAITFTNGAYTVQGSYGGMKVIFSDNYGSVAIEVVQSSYGGGQVQGVISFANTQDHVGNQITPQWVELGQFVGNYYDIVIQ